MNRFLIAAAILVLAATAQAQYWHVDAFSPNDRSVYASMSPEDKKGNYRIYFLDRGNIFGLDPKKDSTFFVTHSPADAPVVRMTHILGKNDLIYMQGQSGRPFDYHLYRVADTGAMVPEDLTPTKEGVQNIMLGASYNGRYIYYSSNKSKLEKIDYYRYDIAQNISEIVFANNKQFELMGWSRDQNLVLLKDPATQKLFASDVQTTERYNFYTAPQKVLMAQWAVDAKRLLVLEEGSGGTEFKAMSFTTPTSVGTDVQTISTGLTSIRYSVEGKFTIEEKNKVLSVKEAATGAEVYSSPDLVEVQTNGKETMILLTVKTNDGLKLKLFDVAKKTITKEFSTVISK